jgi:hypothetical protein
MAQRTASTTLRNSTTAPSPVRLDDAPVMHREYGIDQVAPQRPQPSEDAILVRASKPGVADDVGYQDRREFPGLAH